MNRDYPSLDILRRQFGVNKHIPAQYEEPILKALSHYPELTNTRIDFVLRDKYPVPYGTSPSFTSIFREASKRRYIVSLLQEAENPMKPALFRNLPEEAQRAVIGHELGHVVSYSACSTAELLHYALMYSSLHLRRKAERAADIATIEHGLAFELYVHAVYIRRIPGYVELRKEIDIDYLKPQEILEACPASPPPMPSLVFPPS